MELTAEQCRIVGCLIEKERATPQNYPLTLNSLRLACNQSTNRDPVVDYDDHLIESELASLREQGVTRIVYSTSNRAAKYRHVLDEALRLEDDELAALCVLLLRGPQTQGEIKGRTERLHAFADLGAVQETLDRLASRDEPLVRRLERRPGQKDARYIHLLGDLATTDAIQDDHTYRGGYQDDPPAYGDRAPSPPAYAPAPTGPSNDDLQAEIDALRDELAELRAQFDVFRSQFD